jgi:hypothetical protein
MSYKIDIKSILIVFSVLFLINSSSVFAATLYVSPSTIDNPSLTVGSNFTVGIKVDNVINLYGFDFKLYWNTSLLQLVNASVNKNLWFDYMKWLDSSSNYYEAAYSSKGPFNSFTGNASLAILTFKVISIGNSSLGIKDAILGDSSAFPITYTVINGYFNNQPKVCTCTSWIKTCSSIDTCSVCTSTRTCNPSGCSSTFTRSKICQ